MADIVRDPRLTQALPESPELRQHQQSFHAFSKIVSFAVLHVIAVLAALALAFLGNAPIFAAVVGVGVNLALVIAFVVD